MPIYNVTVTLKGRCSIDVPARNAASAEDQVHGMVIDHLINRCEFHKGITVESVEEVRLPDYVLDYPEEVNKTQSGCRIELLKRCHK